MRRETGGTIPIAVVVLIFIILIGIGYFILTSILGGSRELQNAVDAGNISVATTALVAPEVKLENPDEIIEFAGVATERDGEFYVNLSNINRVWAEALTTVLNAQSLGALGSPEAKAHSELMYRLAQNLSKRLTEQLKKSSPELQGAFQQIADANNLRMLNQPAPNLAPQNYQTSYVDQKTGKLSNVSLSLEKQFEAGLSLPPNAIDRSTGYLYGYQNFDVQGLEGKTFTFDFVPLGRNEKPHLISASTFEAGKDDSFLSSLRGAIPPDAFSYTSKTRAQQAGEDAKLQSAAAAITKDVTAGFGLSIPRGFIRIENDPGVRGTDDHVLEHLSKNVVTSAWKQALSNDKGTGPFIAETMFNPDQIATGFGEPNNALIAQKIGLCFAAYKKGKGYASDCPEPPLGLPCAVPKCLEDGFSLIAGPLLEGQGLGDYKFVSGHAPSISSNGGDNTRLHSGKNAIEDGWFSVHGANANNHKLVFEFEAGRYYWVWAGISAGEFAKSDGRKDFFFGGPVDIDLFFAYLFANLGAGDYASSLQFRLNESALSGMRERIVEGDTQVPSLLDPAGEKKYTRDGSLKTFFGTRKSDPRIAPLYAKLSKRIRQIKPDASDGDIEAVFNDTTEFPMGAQAFIFMQKNGDLKVSIVKDGKVIGGAPLPSWLTPQLRNLPSDASDSEPQFEYLDSVKKAFYRIADPSKDFIHQSDRSFPSGFAQDYPACAANFDRYKLYPSTGFHGLLAVVRLQSGAKALCAVGSTGEQGGSWSGKGPEQCFVVDQKYQGVHGAFKRGVLADAWTYVFP